jgi:hypothetical protein
MDSFDIIELSSGLLTWFTSQNIVIADDVAAVLFGLDEDDCHVGVSIEKFLDCISSRDRPRMSRALYDCIARCDTIHEVFELSIDGRTKVVVLKGRAVGDVLFTGNRDRCRYGLSETPEPMSCGIRARSAGEKR